MEGVDGGEAERLESTRFEAGCNRCLIEHVMMHTSVPHVIQASIPECFEIAGFWVSAQIMKFKDFVKVNQVRFVNAALEVVQQMNHRCYWSTMVERPCSVRQHEEEGASGPQNPTPFVQCLQRVRGVLEHVRRQQEVVAVVRCEGKIRCLRDDVSRGSPNSIPAVGTVLNLYEGVQRERAARGEYLTGPADLDATTPEQAAVFFVPVKSRGPELSPEALG